MKKKMKTDCPRMSDRMQALSIISTYLHEAIEHVNAEQLQTKVFPLATVLVQFWQSHEGVIIWAYVVRHRQLSN